MRIVLICNEYPPRPHAGIGTFVQAMAKGLCEKGHELTVVGLGEEREEHADGNIRVVTVPRSKIQYLGNLISRIRLYRWLCLQVKNKKVEIIEVPDYSGALPLRVHGCTVVVRLHLTYTAESVLIRKKKPRGIFLYEWLTLAVNRNWIGVSSYILQLTQGLFHVSPKNSATIHNFVPPLPVRLPEPPALPSEYLLYAGLVCQRKGALFLAEAVHELMTSRPELHLVYVGGIFNEGGRPIPELVREALGSEISQRVHFLGHIEREQTLACMKRAKVFALPSRLESFGLVVLEAMNCGVPVVYTKNPPGPELVEDGVTGLLADPTSASDFAEKIATLLDNPDLANHLAQNAKKAVSERFSLEKCVEQTEAFYRACLSESKHGIMRSAANSCVASKDKSPIASS